MAAQTLKTWAYTCRMHGGKVVQSGVVIKTTPEEAIEAVYARVTNTSTHKPQRIEVRCRQQVAAREFPEKAGNRGNSAASGGNSNKSDPVDFFGFGTPVQPNLPQVKRFTENKLYVQHTGD